ncbi:MAG: GxxExxY protein [Planctomycetota bacterium]
MNDGKQATELLLKEECYQIMGACFEVYTEMGCGFLEAVYQECLSLELKEREIPFIAQSPLELAYKGRRLEQQYIPDFVCYGAVVVELKAVRGLAIEHRAQVHNYLRATGYRLGLLINFGHYPKVEWERIVL